MASVAEPTSRDSGPIPIIPPADEHRREMDEIYAEHYRNYRIFVRVLTLFVAHVAVILALLAIFLL